VYLFYLLMNKSPAVVTVFFFRSGRLRNTIC